MRFSISWYYNITKMDVVKEPTTLPRWKMSAQAHPCCLQWMTRNPSHYRVDRSWPKNVIHRYSEMVASIYSSNIKVNLKWKRNCNVCIQKPHLTMKPGETLHFHWKCLYQVRITAVNIASVFALILPFVIQTSLLSKIIPFDYCLWFIISVILC